MYAISMTTKRLKQIEKQIEKIKTDLLGIGEMRPGALSLQYKDPKKKKGAYYQLSYTHKMKSKTEYVRSSFLQDLKKQIVAYKKFRKLTEKWIDLSIEYSKSKMKLEKLEKQK